MENDSYTPRAILAGLFSKVMTPGTASDEQSMDELEALTRAAGAEPVLRVVQNRYVPDAGTYLGDGKIEEIGEAAKNFDAELIIFDNELSPAQTRNIENITGVRVLDRSGIILDIFASRAKSAAGRLQVELAQYKYLLPRLIGRGIELSRLGGGIGARGPGETKLETDRRHIRERISRLKEELSDLSRVRDEERKRREKNEIPVVALVGYTNSGKSTLLNALTGAGIPANDRLFDTLDTTTRIFPVSDRQNVLLSDTVGFIRRLPHHLIDAFAATLSELSHADIILHVADASSPDLREHMEVTNSLISKLCREDALRLTVFNKTDLCEIEELPCESGAIYISAKSGAGLDDLKDRISKHLQKSSSRLLLKLPYSGAGLLDILYREAKVENVEYLTDYIEVRAVCSSSLKDRVRDYIYKDL